MTPDVSMNHFTGCNLQQLLKPFAIDAPEIELEDLVLDSREVAIHKGFLAVAGHSLDGRDFIPQAISLGARVIVADTDDAELHGKMDMREHSLIVNFHDLSQHLSKLAQVFFGEPTKQLNTIAVTGTNGKTSTVNFCCQLSERLGEPAWYVGTLGFGFLGNLQESKNTTPDAISMQRMARQSLSTGCKLFAFEASSHALVQGRVADVSTNIAIFTNLSRDHLDYHGSMEAYAEAKRQLLKQPGLQTVILNADDAEHLNWLDDAPENVNIVLVGSGEAPPSAAQYCFASDVQFNNAGMRFTLQSSWGTANLEIPLFGEFNVHNVLSAAAAHLASGKDFDLVVLALKKVAPVDGRVEFFRKPNQPNVVVDYAHTPDALEQILRTLRPHCAGKLVCVFGCGGDRDKGKRSKMGQAAAQYADMVVLTNDNSRSEDPYEIISHIKQGIPRVTPLLVELDREKAIRWAFENSSADDLILVAGKGHETTQVIGDSVVQYDERQVIAAIVDVQILPQKNNNNNNSSTKVKGMPS